MANLSAEIVAFANGNTDFYEAFADYHNHKSEVEWGKKMGSYDASVSLSEKQSKVSDAFFAELERLSGCKRDGALADAWFANPMVKWAEMALVNAAINVVLPMYVTATFAPFVDFRTVGMGDIVKFEIPARTFYTVSKGARGERTTFRQNKYKGDMILTPIEHKITTYVDMARVLAGKDDLAEAVRKIVISIELDMNAEIIAALNAGLAAASYPSAFLESGAFDAATLVKLCQRVQAYNGLAKPIVMGTAAALMNVLPDSSAGYRMNIDGQAGVVSYVKNFYGFDLYELPQSPTGVGYGLALDDTKLYIISPAIDKPVKTVMSTALSNSNQFYDNADLSQNYTARKEYASTFITGGFVGQYSITA